MAEQTDLEAKLSDSLVLVVDDNIQNAELLEAYLEPVGCQTRMMSDGAEVMAYLADESNPLPDLVLLDVMMPRMSGFEVCQRIKSDERTAVIPVIMVTALNELGDIERGVESGTDDFLSKPVNKQVLLTRVKTMLKLRHTRRDLDQMMTYFEDVDKPGG